MKRIAFSELKKGNEYFVLTKIGEAMEFVYQGGVNIVLPCGTTSFLIDSDEVYECGSESILEALEISVACDF